MSYGNCVYRNCNFIHTFDKPEYRVRMGCSVIKSRIECSRCTWTGETWMLAPTLTPSFVWEAYAPGNDGSDKHTIETMVLESDQHSFAHIEQYRAHSDSDDESMPAAASSRTGDAPAYASPPTPAPMTPPLPEPVEGMSLPAASSAPNAHWLAFPSAGPMSDALFRHPGPQQ